MIAIHPRPGSFSERWIQYCDDKNIPYIFVNLFDTHLISNLREQNVTHLLFNLEKNDYKRDLILKSIVLILEKEGIKVFPSFNSFWHYDDKLKQKYLFEQLNIPHAPMHVFYSKDEALNWIVEKAKFPFVFKLKGGAGSANVKLVESKSKAIKIINEMFGKGLHSLPSVSDTIQNRMKVHYEKHDWKKIIKKLPEKIKYIYNRKKYLPVERGYFLSQDFYPANDYDTRVTIIGDDKAFAFRRHNRKNDFRASGSGSIDYNHNKIDREMITMAFEAAQKIGGTSLAFDFVYDLDRKPKILEVAYCYASYAVYEAGGYWTNELKYHPQKMHPEELIIESHIN